MKHHMMSKGKGRNGTLINDTGKAVNKLTFKAKTSYGKGKKMPTKKAY